MKSSIAHVGRSALALAPAASGEIRSLIDRASDALARAVTAADVLDAKDQAAFAYDQAKSAARLLRAKGAHDDVVAAVYRAQADALEIESLAKRRLADEYDQAQAQGEVASHGGGRNFKVSDENLEIPTIAEIGLTKTQVFEARQLRDAIESDPGIIRRALDGILATGAEPTKAELKRIVAPPKANLRAAVGTASASKADRGANFYQTPEAATLTLLALESFSSTIWEPACGLGAISRVLEAQGYEVRISDLVDRGTATADGEAQAVGDFLRSAPGAAGAAPDIVTNPPYGEVLNEFVAHALRVHRPRKMALLLNLNFLCGFKSEDRGFVMDENPPARVHVFKRRLPMMHREGWEGPKASSRMNTAWFVWELQPDGTYGSTTVMRRVDWADYADADALTPGKGGSFVNAEFFEEDLTRETPRMTLDERINAARAAAIGWVAGRECFDRAELRREIGVRDSVAAALIDEMVANGLISPADLDDRHAPLPAEQVAA
ncbi:hypothetical protein [Rhizobium sp. CC-YZS058]|uniref:hypothetical protein n=1 Tax=Rhizobium sp. CC-YZS058 TaxID=3042153 RepID=UPI002B056F53|nr:hypothetical protein [Rhizobium sp. CC-YZS058]MEA3534266.1 hypothetical protein [Rhizobium sp. CC-YZS058]